MEVFSGLCTASYIPYKSTGGHRIDFRCLQDLVAVVQLSALQSSFALAVLCAHR